MAPSTQAPTTPQLKKPPATWTEVVRGPPSASKAAKASPKEPKAKPAIPSKRQGPASAADLVNWTSFRVVGLGNKFGKKGQPLSARLESTLRSLLGVTIKVVNAFPSPRGFIVQVANLNQASAVVRSRPNLKGSSIVVLDVFSPEDQERYDRLWKVYEKAKKAGLSAQFDRAVLQITKGLADGTTRTFSLSDSSDDALAVVFGGDPPTSKAGVDTEMPST